MKIEIKDNTTKYPALMRDLNQGIYLFAKEDAKAVIISPPLNSFKRLGELSEISISNCTPFIGEIILKN